MTRFTQTHVSAQIHNGPVASRKPESFTDKENAVLRIILKKWMEKVKLSQTKAGVRLGVGQQAIGTIVNGGGFSRPTATALAVTQGYESAEALLDAHGALASAPGREAGEWRERDLAVGTARRLGYQEPVLDRVVARYAESQFQTRPPKWWMDRIVHTAAEMEDDLRAVPAAPKSEANIPAATVAPKRKRGAA